MKDRLLSRKGWMLRRGELQNPARRELRTRPTDFDYILWTCELMVFGIPFGAAHLTDMCFRLAAKAATRLRPATNVVTGAPILRQKLAQSRLWRVMKLG